MTTNAPPDSPDGHASDPRRKLLEQALGAQYEIVRLLGQGGIGTVYLARERMLERLVAVKVLRSDVVSADSRERFTREARTAAKLMHAHIVPLYSFGEVGDTLFYVMGFVEGESLESLLQRVPRMDPDEARRILVEVADALDYAHRNGVVHRDVKPDNVMIERESRRAVLTDFGIAKLQATQQTLTQTGMIVGTPLYMSPEQAAGDAAIDGRSDLYSLGVIGYRMIAGRLPIEGTSAQDVMRRHVMQNPPPLAGLVPDAPIDLTWAVTRCLDKDPSRRWPSAEALRVSLEAGDPSVGELPEQLEHLSGLGARSLLVGWALGVVAALSAVAVDSRTLAAAAVAAPLLALASLWRLASQAKRFGLDQSQTWRLLLAPPERWAGEWPASFRRQGDVWDQLPPDVREFRESRTRALWITTLLIVPVIAMWALRGDIPPRTAIFVLGGLAAAVAGAVSRRRSAATMSLKARDVPERVLRKWLDEPT